jgi:uncharacterized membrane protein
MPACTHSAKERTVEQKQWTTGLEIVAYVVAHLIGIVLIYFASALFMSQIYVSVAKAYGTSFLMMVGVAQSLIVMVLVLFLFLALRAAMMGGIPRPKD